MLAAIARPKDACPSPASAATLPAPAGTVRRAHRLALVLPLALALSAALAAAMLGALAPSSALGGTSLDARCDGVALRSKPSTSSHREARLPQRRPGRRDAGGQRRALADPVRRLVRRRAAAGTAWSASTASPSQKLYGQKAVYGAPSLFRRRLHAARGGLRRRPAPHGHAGHGDREGQAAGRRQGHRLGHASRADAGPPTATARCRGTSWYRITQIGDRRACPRCSASRRCTRPAACCGPTAAEDPAAPRHVRLHRGHRRQPLAGHDRLAGRRRGRQAVRVHEGVGGQRSTSTRPTRRTAPRRTSNGIKVGAYHFAKPDTDAGDAVVEADHFIDDGGAGPAATCCRSSTSRSRAGSDATKLQNWVKAFLDRVYAQTGERAMIYTSPSFWKNNMGDTTTFAAAGYRSCGSPTGPPRPPRPSRPPTGAAPAGPSGSTPRTGRVPGISGRVDLDRYRYADFGRVSVR